MIEKTLQELVDLLKGGEKTNEDIQFVKNTALAITNCLKRDCTVSI